MKLVCWGTIHHTRKFVFIFCKDIIICPQRHGLPNQRWYHKWNSKSCYDPLPKWQIITFYKIWPVVLFVHCELHGHAGSSVSETVVRFPKDEGTVDAVVGVVLDINTPKWSINRHFDVNIVLYIPIYIINAFKHFQLPLIESDSFFHIDFLTFCQIFVNSGVVVVSSVLFNMIVIFRHEFHQFIHIIKNKFRIEPFIIKHDICAVYVGDASAKEAGLIHCWYGLKFHPICYSYENSKNFLICKC